MKERFHSISYILAEAYQNNEWEQVKNLSDEYLELAAHFKQDWNYGNAIHQANTFLGLAALEENDISLANEYLINAGRTTGSPQLNSFGPNMMLAKRLLEKGEVEVVLEYLKLCKGFWYWYLRIWSTRKWKKAISNGIQPNFGANLHYHITNFTSQHV